MSVCMPSVPGFTDPSLHLYTCVKNESYFTGCVSNGHNILLRMPYFKLKKIDYLIYLFTTSQLHFCRLFKLHDQANTVSFT